MLTYTFPRYLAAKRSVDDRALNRQVWQMLTQHQPRGAAGRPVRVLEIGAGTGTMIQRLIEWDLLDHAVYTALDVSAENIARAKQELPAWAAQRGMQVEPCVPDGWLLSNTSRTWEVHLEQIDLFEFLQRAQNGQAWDLLIAHAFLDLVPLPAALPALLRLLRPGGLYYFTLNFDGTTEFEPAIDPLLDELIERLYHQSMDASPAGEASRTGRRLFGQLHLAGAEILAAGASDWVVYAGPQGYAGDEAYFLQHILHFVETSLAGHPRLDAGQFAAWLAQRRAQLMRGELVYIAHQLDFVGRAGQSQAEIPR